MTKKEAQKIWDSGVIPDYLQSKYAEYIVAHCGGDRIICNGDTLIEAMEEGYLEAEFIDWLQEDENV